MFRRSSAFEKLVLFGFVHILDTNYYYKGECSLGSITITEGAKSRAHSVHIYKAHFEHF